MKRLDCLDGLRGVLAMYVALGHMAPFALLPLWLQSAISHGGAAVDVFFILSGLVISQSLARLHGDRGRFLMARVLRIYLVYLPVFVLAIAVQPLSCGFAQMPWIGTGNPARDLFTQHWPDDPGIALASHLAMVHGLLPNGVLPDLWISFLGAAWSLSTEWQFYILAMLAWRCGDNRLTIELLLLALAGLSWQTLAPEPWQFSRAFLPNKAHFAHFFALGVASRAVVRGELTAWRRYAAVAILTVAVCAAHGQAGKLLPPLIWTLCLAAQLCPRIPALHTLHVLLRCRTALWLGAISYPIYLVNEPIQKLLLSTLSRFALGDPLLFNVVWLPLAVGAPILASAWLHRWIEMPAMRWRRTSTAIARRPHTDSNTGIAAVPVAVQGPKRGL
ncbi:MAG: acyltransferase family protein [Rhodopila sp.]